MFVILLFNLFLHADYKLDINDSKFIEADIYLNGYKATQNNFLNFVKVGGNELRVCFKNKTAQYLPIKNHMRIDLKSLNKKTTDIVVDGALTEVKAAPILSFYSLNTNSKNDWVCENKIFNHKGNNYLYFHLAHEDLKKSKTKKAVKRKIINKSLPVNAIDSHQSSIGYIYKKLNTVKAKKNRQAQRNIQALIGKTQQHNILGEWKDIKTGVVYKFTPRHIEVSNMPKGFYMDYKKINSKKLRVKVLNNSFDLLYKMKSQNEMIQKNTQSGVIRELIRL